MDLFLYKKMRVNKNLHSCIFHVVFRLIIPKEVIVNTLKKEIDLKNKDTTKENRP